MSLFLMTCFILTTMLLCLLLIVCYVKKNLGNRFGFIFCMNVHNCMLLPLLRCGVLSVSCLSLTNVAWRYTHVFLCYVDTIRRSRIKPQVPQYCQIDCVYCVLNIWLSVCIQFSEILSWELYSALFLASCQYTILDRTLMSALLADRPIGGYRGVPVFISRQSMQ